MEDNTYHDDEETTVREDTPSFLVMPKMKMQYVRVLEQEPYTKLLKHFTSAELDIIVKQCVDHLCEALRLTGAENNTTEHLRALLRGGKYVQARRHK